MIGKEDLKELYHRRHLTMAEIGSIYGVSRARVSQLCRQYGLSIQEGENVQCACDRCGKEFKRTRKQWRKMATHYCSIQCYLSDRKNENYRPHRNGQKEARRVMAKHLGRPLMLEEVVHHIDSNCQNNELSNLMLFPNHKAHIKWHHAVRIACKGAIA